MGGLGTCQAALEARRFSGDHRVEGGRFAASKALQLLHEMAANAPVGFDCSAGAVWREHDVWQ